jgi:hypothetical protein
MEWRRFEGRPCEVNGGFGAALGTMGALPPLSERGVGRDSVEPFQRLKFSVSGLEQGQSLNLES